MHRFQRTCYEAGALAGPTNPPSTSSDGRARRSTPVLLVTRDQSLTDRLTQSLSEFAGGTLKIESVDRVSGATQRGPSECQALAAPIDQPRRAAKPLGYERSKKDCITHER